MSPWFLRDVAGPHDYAGATSFVHLWRLKEALAKGRPCDMGSDINEVMNDIIFAVAFGVSRGAIQAKIEALSQQTVDAATDLDEEQIFPTAKRSSVYEDIHTVFTSPEIALKSPLGAWHLAFALKYYPELRQAVKRKDRFIQQMLDEAWQKFSQPSSSDDKIKSAADLLIAREVAQSRKSGRQAQYDSPMVKDELFLFLLGGFDTVPTTVKWDRLLSMPRGIKFLTRHQEVQTKLRRALTDSFKEARSRGEPPSADEIERTKVPYLDAFLEEVTRVSCTSMSNGRITTQAVDVLGYRIPKGVEVWTMNVGPSQTAPRFEIARSKRRGESEAEREISQWTGDWDEPSLAEFIPERWLSTTEDGTVGFDPRAGPNHVFGAGPRGCFGRKLAMRSMRTLFVLVLWEFELRSLPENLASFAAKDLLTHQPQLSYISLRSQPL
ncbi:hypothetical protein LTR86_005418 [Recurvomyces mirabilis]|nr:hypothetical protein LTR86_005418 [Recurvomyces mirabilis]